MTVSTASVLSAMLSLAPYAGDASDTPEERAELLRPVAESIARVSKKDDRRAALLIAQGFEDSGFARYVLEGRCHEGPLGARCDDGRSIGPYQVAVRYCPELDLDGQAKCAFRAAWGGVRRCGKHAQSPVHAWFVGLAGARVPCTWATADKRARTYRIVLQLLRRSE